MVSEIGHGLRLIVAQRRHQRDVQRGSRSTFVDHLDGASRLLEHARRQIDMSTRQHQKTVDRLFEAGRNRGMPQVEKRRRCRSPKAGLGIDAACLVWPGWRASGPRSRGGRLRPTSDGQAGPVADASATRWRAGAGRRPRRPELSRPDQRVARPLALTAGGTTKDKPTGR